MIKREVWDGVCEHVPFIVQGQIVSFFFLFFWWGTGTWRLHVCMAVVAVCFKSQSNNQERRGFFFSLSPSPPPHPVELRNSVLIMVL